VTARGMRKDLWTGILYVVIGVSAFLIARNYTLGSAGRMGPGYFPAAVSLLLVVIGSVIVGRSFLVDGSTVRNFAIRPMAVVLCSIVAFGLLLTRAGFLVAGAVLVLGCAMASERFRLDWIPAIGMVGLIGACAFLFIGGMGIPMPLVGPWFGGQGQ
jgi:Tripartite tricarboxylate transporter TctB family